MRRILVSTAVTLDGHFAGPAGEIDWQALDEDFDNYSRDLLDQADTLLLGHVTYELMRAYWPTATGDSYDPGIADRMNQHTKYVAATRPVELSWPNSRHLDGDLGTAVRALRRQSGGDIVVLGSGSLVVQLTELGLVDEYRLVLTPVVLGAGRQLFPGSPRRHALHLTDVRRFRSGALLLTYRPEAGAPPA